VKLAVSSYSFNRFGSGPEGADVPTFTTMMRRCTDLGIDGIELLGVQFASTDRAELNSLKRNALRQGVQIVAVSAHHNFIHPDRAERRRQIDILCHWIDVADALGAPIVRAFGGRWNTLAWDPFMAAAGVEPPLPGYTEDDGYQWTIDALRIASYYAERRGVVVGLENHWGFTGTAAGVLRILEGVGSSWLQVALDIGNFVYTSDQYAEIAALAPHAAIVHAKTYVGGGMYYDAGLDYARVVSILDAAGYNGYLSIECEGKAHPDIGIPESVKVLRGALK
jgi:sugar phosphate isomerase/epimerase